MTVHLSERPAPVATLPVVRPRPVPSVPRVRRIVLEVARFAVVGGSGVAVNILFFNLALHGLTWAPMAATVVASCVAMGTNYLGFRYFAYRDRASRTRRQIALFFAFSGLGVAMESVLFYLRLPRPGDERTARLEHRQGPVDRPGLGVPLRGVPDVGVPTREERPITPQRGPGCLRLIG